jgi:hypothetical protein
MAIGGRNLCTNERHALTINGLPHLSVSSTIANPAGLNYMSIDELLKALCEAGKLVRWEPNYDADQTAYREIYLDPSVRDWLHPRPPLPLKELQRCADVRRYLKGFVVGGHFDDVEKLKNLDSEPPSRAACQGRWAIRIKRVPQARIFGGFPEANIFVGSHVAARDQITSWPAEKAALDQFWATLTVDQTLRGQTTRHTLPRLTRFSRTYLVSNTRQVSP